MYAFLQAATLTVGTLTTGLIAGLFFGFSTAIMPGLRVADDRTFVDTMQRVNVAILNPRFLLSYIGALLLTGAAAVMQFWADDQAALPWIIAGFVLYLVTLVITGGLNIPLNNALAAAGEIDSIKDVKAVRTAFEAKWVKWHLARTVTAIAALGSLIWALVEFSH